MTPIMDDAEKLKSLCDMVLNPYKYELAEMDAILKRAEMTTEKRFDQYREKCSACGVMFTPRSNAYRDEKCGWCRSSITKSESDLSDYEHAQKYGRPNY